MARSTSLASRLPSAVCTSIPLLLLIPAFILAVYSASIKNWSYHDNYSLQDSTQLTNITHRSPFVSCTLETLPPSSDNSSTTANDDSSAASSYFVETCQAIRSSSGLCDSTATSTKADNEHFCSQLSLSARLLYAGDALIALSLLLVFILTAATLPQVLTKGGYDPHGLAKDFLPEGSEHIQNKRPGAQSASAYLTLLFRLCVIFGGVILFLGTILATNTLVNINFPIGDWYSSGDPLAPNPASADHQGPWMMGRAVGISIAGATLALVAGALAGMVWETPKVPILGSGRASTASGSAAEYRADKNEVGVSEEVRQDGR